MICPAGREVRLADHEGAVRLRRLKRARGVDRVGDRDAEPAAGREHSRGLVRDTAQIVHVHQHHERDDEVAGVVLDRKRRRVCLRHVERRVGAARGLDEGRRRVKPTHVVAEPLQIAGESSLAAADV